MSSSSPTGGKPIGGTPWSPPLDVAGLAVLLLVAALGRVLAPDYVRSLVPPWVPHPRAVAALTGAVELVLAGALVCPASRRRAAQATAALIAVYLTSHLDAAVRATPERQRWLDRPGGVGFRLAANMIYIAWSVRVAIRSDTRRAMPDARTGPGR